VLTPPPHPELHDVAGDQVPVHGVGTTHAGVVELSLSVAPF